MPMKILIVVVRYNTPLERSETVASIGNIFRDRPSLLDSFEVLLWDNSPEALKTFNLPFSFRYEHSKSNAGVGGAYNEALNLALSQNFSWLLLLDQDSILPGNFLSRMLDYGRQLLDDVRVAAVAPAIWVNSRYMFPRLVTFGGTKACDPTFAGVEEDECTTANSGCLMRVSALQEVGGYSKAFPFEFSDVYVFHQMHRAGKRLWIAADLRIDHDLAILDYGGAMTPQRYISFIVAEDLFIRQYKSCLENAAYTIRLFARVLKQYAKYRDKRFAKTTLSHLRRRLLNQSE